MEEIKSYSKLIHWNLRLLESIHVNLEKSEMGNCFTKCVPAQPFADY